MFSFVHFSSCVLFTRATLLFSGLSDQLTIQFPPSFLRCCPGSIICIWLLWLISICLYIIFILYICLHCAYIHTLIRAEKLYKYSPVHTHAVQSAGTKSTFVFPDYSNRRTSDWKDFLESNSCKKQCAWQNNVGKINVLLLWNNKQNKYEKVIWSLLKCGLTSPKVELIVRLKRSEAALKASRHSENRTSHTHTHTHTNTKVLQDTHSDISWMLCVTQWQIHIFHVWDVFCLGSNHWSIIILIKLLW